MGKKSGCWMYILEKNYTWDSKHPISEDMVFFDRGGIARLIIEQNRLITVTRDYAWNGCSPKVCFWDIMLGTPDGVVDRRTKRLKTFYATLIHDALYQFLSTGLPLTRRDADDFFLRLLEESDFAPRWLCWVAVSLFGGFFWPVTKWKRQLRGTHLRVSEFITPEMHAAHRSAVYRSKKSRVKHRPRQRSGIAE